ncbi:MAG: SRPBCC domain-containing protein [Henriciella sp.]|nr:SRPBCC domain-containing protein [Henriciella sp.]
MTELPMFVMEREFDAPRELVWRTWTELELLGHWYGPGVETVVHKLDVRVGGAWLNEMKMGERSGYQRCDYTEVVKPERLVMLMSTTDADWNLAANPMMPDWPRVLLTTVTFEDAGSKTKMRLEWSPHEATDAEIACFVGVVENLGKGWGAGMVMLEEMLADLQA